MNLMEIFFWLCVICVLYTYFLYPLLLAVLNHFVHRESFQRSMTTSVSLLLPVHNEENNLTHRLEELTQLIQSSGYPGEILVVSDASTDHTVEIARRFADHGVRVLELTSKQGKAAALNAGVAVARHELLIFADARQRWAADALTRLVENFADPRIGAVSGDLILEGKSGVLAGVGMYWRFEKWLRKQESRFGSQVGVTGAISAVRRPLFRSIPPGTLLDDVYWPLHVVLQGYRVIHDERAQAFDRLPDKPRDEFRRKIRTLAGNFQLVTLMPFSALMPWRNRVWWQWVSHKLMRLVVPWALVGMLIASYWSLDDGYTYFFWAQIAGYGLALLGMVPWLARRVKILGAAASFLVLNTAAWLAFWVWVSGRASQSWHKVQYEVPVKSN